MPRRARQYDIYLPLTTNEGQSIPKKRFIAVEQQLVQRFRGLTAQRREFPLQGIWQGKTRLYVDEVIVMTALDFRKQGSARFIARLKGALLQDFEQIEILITESSLWVQHPSLLVYATLSASLPHIFLQFALVQNRPLL